MPYTRATVFCRRIRSFARACREAQIAFIGPTPESMEILGDKLRSKDIALERRGPGGAQFS